MLRQGIQGNSFLMLYINATQEMYKQEYYRQISHKNRKTKPKLDINKTNLGIYLKDQTGFSPGMQIWFNDRKCINLFNSPH